MDRFHFRNKVREMAEKIPGLFTLETDCRANMEMIERVEKYYNVILPNSYKDFVNQYGGVTVQ